MALNFIVKFEESVIFVTGAFVALAMFTQVLLRYVFHAPLFGLEEIAVLVVSWFYFVGAAYSVHNESYIKADILPLVVKNPKIIRFLNILSLILTIVANLILFYHGLKFAIWAGRNNVVTPTFLISKNFSFSSLLLGCILTTLHFVIILQREIKRKI